MKTSKYTASLIGLITAVICFLSLYTFILPVLFLLPTALPFEYISGWIVGANNYPNKFIAIISMESVLLLISCVWYFKKLIGDKRKQVKFSRKKLILFFVVLQFIVHPIGFYIWLLNNTAMDINDSMIMFYIVETVSYSGCFFIVLGVIIDLIRNKNMKKAGSTNAVRLS